ncbi:MAG TPA: hypothetical protein VMV78_01025 [Thiobacillus sp.]|jgi:protease I|nr:hypothetical protein [Thiobacillus sp.]
MKALIVSADHFEDSELLFPFYRLQEAGLVEVDPQAYDLPVLPGGKAPATLRKDAGAIPDQACTTPWPWRASRA